MAVLHWSKSVLKPLENHLDNPADLRYRSPVNTNLERIRAEARSLSPNERELLLVAIDHDLHGDVPHDDDAGVEDAWECEIASRIRDIKEGKVELVRTESVDAALDAVFARHGIERTQRFV